MNSLILASTRWATCLVTAGILSLGLVHSVNAESPDVLTSFKDHVAQLDSLSGVDADARLPLLADGAHQTG